MAVAVINGVVTVTVAIDSTVATNNAANTWTAAQQGRLFTDTTTTGATTLDFTYQNFYLTATGNITFPLLNEIPVAERTVEEIQKDIESRLRDGYIKEPHVTVHVLQYNEQFYTIMGEVMIDGIYPLPPEKKIDLVEAIAKANGFSPNAKESKIELWRNGEKKVYDFNDLLKIKDPDKKIFIKQVAVISSTINFR